MPALRELPLTVSSAEPPRTVAQAPLTWEDPLVEPALDPAQPQVVPLLEELAVHQLRVQPLLLQELVELLVPLVLQVLQVLLVPPVPQELLELPEPLVETPWLFQAVQLPRVNRVQAAAPFSEK